MIDEKANKALRSFPSEVQAKFLALFRVLETEGKLREPFAKRLTTTIFEIRVVSAGQWRALYAYLQKKEVLILSAFHKKTQKTPKKELEKAEKRLRKHL